jgi:hypothetical protein
MLLQVKRAVSKDADDRKGWGKMWQTRMIMCVRSYDHVKLTYIPMGVRGILCAAASGDPQQKALAVVGMKIHGSRNIEAVRVIMGASKDSLGRALS